MEELKELMLEQFRILNSKMDASNEYVSRMDQDLKRIKQESDKLKSELDAKDERINYLENIIKEKNVVLYGIEEDEGETTKEIEETIIDIFQNKMKAEVTASDIDAVYRVGKGKKTRPVIVQLTTRMAKRRITDNRGNLRGTDIFVNDDLCMEDRRKARETRIVCKKLREEGNEVQIKGKRLILNGKIVDKHTLDTMVKKLNAENEEVREQDNTVGFPSIENESRLSRVGESENGRQDFATGDAGSNSQAYHERQGTQEQATRSGDGNVSKYFFRRRSPIIGARK